MTSESMHLYSEMSSPRDGEMAECARQLVLEPYLVLLNDVRLSSHYVWSFKIFFNSFSVLINQLPSCFVLCLSLCVCFMKYIHEMSLSYSIISYSIFNAIPL